jgi:chromosome segregation ATPase
MSQAVSLDELNAAIDAVEPNQWQEVEVPEAVQINYDTRGRVRNPQRNTIIVRDISQFIGMVPEIPHDYSGLMMIFGQLYQLRKNYQQLSDRYPNDSLLNSLQVVIDEYEKLFVAIASRLNKLSPATKMQAVEVILQSTRQFDFEPNCSGRFGSEINCMLKNISDYRSKLEFFERGTRRTQSILHSAEQDNEDNHHREIEQLNEIIRTRDNRIAHLELLIDNRQAEVDRLTQAYQKMTDTNNVNETERVQFEQRCSRLSDQMAALQNSLQTVERECGNKKEELRITTLKLTESRARAEKLEEQLAEKVR